jgi:ATP/maltotriose-dependent transcriptional regulator MalT
VAEAAAGRFADALAGAASNLEAIREHRVGMYYEPLLLATMARCELALGDAEAALSSAEEAVAIMDDRGLTTCALRAPIALAQVLAATQGVSAAERIDSVLTRALGVARRSGARLFEPHIERERGALARLRGGDRTAARR